MTTETPPNVRGNNKQDKVRKPKRSTLDRLQDSCKVASRKQARANKKLMDLRLRVAQAENEVRAAEQEVFAYESAIERLKDNDTPVVK